MWEGPQTQPSTPRSESSTGQREGTSQVPGRVRSPCQGYTLMWPGVRPRSQASVSGTSSQCSGWQLLAVWSWASYCTFCTSFSLLLPTAL